jgi:hypothetical protein
VGGEQGLADRCQRKTKQAERHPMSRRRSLGRIEVLNRIEARLLAEIKWINSHKKPLGDRMDAARWAFRKAIKIVRDHHVIFQSEEPQP